MQGTFDSLADKQSFQRALGQAFAGEVRISAENVAAGDGAPGDQFGFSVALSGDTALVGAFQDDTPAGAAAGSAYVFTRSGTAWLLQAKLTAGDGAPNDRFGISVALSGDTALVGAFFDDTPAGVDAGSAYVFTRSGTAWSQQAKLTAGSDSSTLDYFGRGVALSGDTALVGAPGDDTPAGANAGSAYVFTRSGTLWSQQQRLNADVGAANDGFGNSVALSGDTALVGANFDDTSAGVDAGSAYVFNRSGTLWSQQQILNANDGATDDEFGSSVALSGVIALVGASFDDTPAGADAGSAYVFVRGAIWFQQAKLTAGDGAAGDQLGYSVALSGDTALVGAYLDDTPAGADAGSAYVFTRSATVWSQQAKLTPGDGAADDRVGLSVALSDDTALVGAYFDDTPAGEKAGSASTFTRSFTAWSQQAQLTAGGDGAASDLFGFSVALSGDTALVGTNFDDTPAGVDAGSAYVFTRSGTMWSQQAKLTAGDGAPGDQFGLSVALSGDTALVGAYLDDTSAGADAGSAYIFTRSGTLWSQQAKLIAGDGASPDRFGISVALSGNTALVGAYVDDTPAGGDAGSAYIFTRSGTLWSQQAKLTASDGAPIDRFGFSAALTGDTALVGAYLDDTPAGADAGSAYIFTRTGMLWSEQSKLTATDGAPIDRFGISVALSGDTALVGAYLDDTPAGADAGSAYIFTPTSTLWFQRAKLNAGDGAASDQFGISVALSGDTALVGAFLDDTPAGADAGSAYTFTRSGTLWSQQSKLTAGDGAAGDAFGYSVALSGNTALVGAYGDDSAVTGNEDLGSAYLYIDNGILFKDGFESVP